MNSTLSPFSTHHSRDIAAWPTDLEEARAWAGMNTTFPLEADQFDRWHDDADVHPYVTHERGALVAYGELWVDRAVNEIELARIIVRPSHRNIGVGTSFVGTLIRQAEEFGIDYLYVRVLPTNCQAIACYQSAGFAAVSKSDREVFNAAQPVRYAWLKYCRDEPPV